LIRAYAMAEAEQRPILERAMADGDASDAQRTAAIIANTDAIAYTRDLANQEAVLARDALDELTDSELREALRWLANFAVGRDH
jgi:octaprenyl-diphosphate synthase